ncbi:MAG: FkbM family methyltransferase [Gemmataceae bacterium]
MLLLMGVLRDLYRRYLLYRHRPRHWRFRPNTLDARLFRHVVIQDEYRLPRLNREDVCLDIGAHIGSFALAAVRRGAGKVVCVEPEPGNLALLRHNLAPYPQVQIHAAAVWPRAGQLHLYNPLDPRNTGAGQVLLQSVEHSIAVPAIALDDLLRELGPVRLLKLDCEGAEWPLLEEATQWEQVQAICGEYHLPPLVPRHRLADPERLRQRLSELGFRVQLTTAPGSKWSVGLFFADRRALT